MLDKQLLQQAERHVRQAEQCVDRQRKLLRRLEWLGADYGHIRLARDLLEAFEMTLYLARQRLQSEQAAGEPENLTLRSAKELVDAGLDICRPKNK